MADSFSCGRKLRQIYREMVDVARFMEEDFDDLVYRRFERLQLYNLGFIQHELSHISEEVLSCEDNQRADDIEKLGKSYLD